MKPTSQKPKDKNGLLSFAAIACGIVLLVCFGLMLAQNPHHTVEGEPDKYALSPKQIDWQFDGVFGTFDRQSAQRGLKVYREVCAACHGLSRVAFRNLIDIGFSEAEVKAIAAEYSYSKINDEGDEIEVPGVPANYFTSPFANEQAARSANNGAYPPDFSLLVKARVDGANYIHSLLTGYGERQIKKCVAFDDQGECSEFTLANEEDKAAEKAEIENFKLLDEKFMTLKEAEFRENAREEILKQQAESTADEKETLTVDKAMIDAYVEEQLAMVETPDRSDEEMPAKLYSCEGRDDNSICVPLSEGMYYNPYYPNRQIAMAPPFVMDGQVEYEDGTNASIEQMSIDVVNFMQWSAEPEMEERKRMGVKVMLFLLVFTGVFIIVKRRIWSDVK